MYAPFEAEADLEQGDVIDNVVLTHIPRIVAPKLYDATGEVVEFDSTQPLPDGVEVLAHVQKSRVIILTQSCDILTKDFICVAPVIPLEEFDRSYVEKRDARKNADLKAAKHIKDLYQRVGAKPDAFYLKEDADFPKSVAWFGDLHSINRTPENIAYLKRNRIRQLNGEAREDLQYRLGFFFGRFATSDDYMLNEEERDLVRPAEAAIPTPPATAE